MKVLFISDRREGGIRQHVRCLRACLPPDVEHYAIGEDEPFAGRNGHDWREWFQMRRVVRAFKPDVVHFHTIPLLMALYVKWVARVPCACSIHTPSRARPAWDRRLLNWAVQPCYWLPVSGDNWKNFRLRYPRACGEVFFNPICLSEAARQAPNAKLQAAGARVVGMVGRNADQKDWPSFHAVERIVTARRQDVSFLNAGEKAACDGMTAIRQMDLFLLTSKHEEMPTVALECFAAGTPMCGFIPKGGMAEILAFSEGPLKEAFIAERDCAKLAAIVERVLDDADLRAALVADGRRIAEKHFDAEKNVRGQLMDVYRRMVR